MKKYCWTTAAIKFESIFIGSKISFQVKLYEADIELVNSGKKRLLPRQQPQLKVEVDDDDEVDDDHNEKELSEDNEDVSSIISDVDDIPDPEPEPVKTVKKITKVVKKKKE